MPFLGAHLSIAGGLPKAVVRAEAAACEALQIFTKSVGQWNARPLADEEVQAFRDAVAASRLRAVVAHASYLVNIASANPALRAQSLASLGEEIDRAERLGLLGLVMHPGSGTEGEGLARIADGLSELLDARRGGRTLILLEHTAGQGTNLGHRFEHLAAIVRLMPDASRIGVCLDTCHLIASGYDIVTEAGYEETWRQFEILLGFDRLKVMHLNDSKKPCGSRIDRHEHIGKGCLGLPPFARLLNDPRFAQLPMMIETEKATSSARGASPLVDPYDARNLRTLRGLIDASATSGGGGRGPGKAAPPARPTRRAGARARG